MSITITHLKANPEMYVEFNGDGIHYASNLESNFEGDFNLLMDCISANIEEGTINFDKGFQAYLDQTGGEVKNEHKDKVCNILQYM